MESHSPESRKSLGTIVPRSLFVLLLVFTGCQTYQPGVMLAHYWDGDLEAAYEEVVDPPWHRRHRSHDQLAWDLEEGKLLHDLQRYGESAEVLSRALESFRRYAEEEATLSVSNELRGLLAGQVLREYRSNYAEAILGETYVALNDLALGDPANARTACIRAADWQSDAERFFARQIERDQQLAKEDGIRSSDLESHPGYEAIHRELETHVDSSYADYLNPFATFVSAIVHFALGERARAREDLEAIAGMVNNPYVRELRNGVLAGDAGTVYVVFEQGLAPEKVPVTIPIFTDSRGLSVVSIPTLIFDEPGRSRLRVSAGGRDLVTERLVSMNSVVAKQFMHDLPGILIRTLIGTLAREGLSIEAEEAAKRSLGSWGWVGEVLTTVYKVAASGADIRSWRSIGSDYQVAVFPRPPDSRLEVFLEDQRGGRSLGQTLELPLGRVIVVLARSMSSGILIVHQPFDATGEGRLAD